ncbi:MAG: ester cyclase [Deltaproteobacteria bacterium]|nr:ester cyclase [Deltaproteobacteria bacterium]
MQSALDSLCAVDLDGATQIFSEDCICELSSRDTKTFVGRKGQKTLWSRLQMAFPDAHIQTKQVLESSGFWVLEAVISGTHQGTFLGQAPTQRLVGCQIAVFCWIEDQKIKRAFVVGNPDTVLRQMTMDPAKAPAIPEVPEHPVLYSTPGAPDNAKAVKDFFKAFEKGDWERMGQLVSPKIVVWSFGDGQQYAGFKRLQSTLSKEQEALEGHVEVLQTMAAGPYVAILVEVKGKLLKNLGPLRAGKSFFEKGVDVFRFERGKIIEWRNYRNQADLIAQLTEPAESTIIKPE